MWTLCFSLQLKSWSWTHPDHALERRNIHLFPIHNCLYPFPKRGRDTTENFGEHGDSFSRNSVLWRPRCIKDFLKTLVLWELFHYEECPTNWSSPNLMAGMNLWNKVRLSSSTKEGMLLAKICTSGKNKLFGYWMSEPPFEEGNGAAEICFGAFITVKASQRRAKWEQGPVKKFLMEKVVRIKFDRRTAKSKKLFKSSRAAEEVS